MRKIRLFLFLILGGIAVSLTSCVSYEEVQVIGVEDVVVKQFSKKGIELDVILKIKNPNFYAVNVVGSDIKAFMGSRSLGKAKLDNKVRIPGDSEEAHTFTISADYKDVLAGALGNLFSLLGERSLDIRISGEVKARALLVTRKFPVELSQKVRLDQSTFQSM